MLYGIIVNYFIDKNRSIITFPYRHQDSTVIRINEDEETYPTFRSIEYTGKVERIRTIRETRIFVGYRNIHTDQIIDSDEWKARFGKYFSNEDYDDSDDSDDTDDDGVPVTNRAMLISKTWIHHYMTELVEVEEGFQYHEGLFDTENPFIVSNFTIGRTADTYIYNRQAAIQNELEYLVQKYKIPFSNSEHSFLRFAKLFNLYAFSECWSDTAIQKVYNNTWQNCSNLYRDDMERLNRVVMKAIALERNVADSMNLTHINTKLKEVNALLNQVVSVKKTQNDLRLARDAMRMLQKVFDDELLKSVESHG